jgi:hypothetical protein
VLHVPDLSVWAFAARFIVETSRFGLKMPFVAEIRVVVAEDATTTPSVGRMLAGVRRVVRGVAWASPGNGFPDRLGQTPGTARNNPLQAVFLLCCRKRKNTIYRSICGSGYKIKRYWQLCKMIFAEKAVDKMCTLCA